LHAESLRLFSDLGIKQGVASALAGLATVAGIERDYARAAQLLGAAEAVWADIGAVPDPFERERIDWLSREACRELGADRYGTARNAGSEADLDEALICALGNSRGRPESLRSRPS
jgi:hypothetical protein